MSDMRKLIESINTINEGDNSNVAGDLYEIYEQMKELIGQAGELVERTSEGDRAKSYWLAHIKMALDDDHGYMGRGGTTMRDTIEALENNESEDEDDEDDGSLAHAARVNGIR